MNPNRIGEGKEILKRGVEINSCRESGTPKQAGGGGIFPATVKIAEMKTE